MILLCLQCTFASCEIEVEVDNVGAATEALRGAQLPPEVSVQQRVRRYPDGSPIEAARRDAPFRLDPVDEPLGADLRRGARVGAPGVPLQHAAHSRRRHRVGAGAGARVQALALHAGPCKASPNVIV